ncbi:dual specificity protein phosphatase 1-like isoform X2 [Salvia splendens]|uniref:dual specificity protein phosphatase 1-like isoform X2 n=1 Tax=Salvia splendens TaxID=180675 RepID=UPI001C2722F1|nr:dual specificity protein phosphatase 1-like isoform X2 [Salvia splendens]
MAGDAYKEHIAGLLKVIRASKIVKEDNIPCLIEDGLFLGSLGAANNKTALKALNVTHILTVAYSLIPSHPNDFVYKVIEVRDTEDVKLSQYFDESFAFIDEAKASGGGILVHCFLGRSRSYGAREGEKANDVSQPRIHFTTRGVCEISSRCKKQGQISTRA